MTVGGYVWTISYLVIAIIFYLVWPVPESSYDKPIVGKIMRFVLRWFPGTAWLFLGVSVLFRNFRILPYPLQPEWFGYGGFILFFLTVVALVYDRAIASGALS
ncbi:MAG TPA: hypothetical protein ENK25_03775 [Bacteroidetes bacterium]|nr:hypothetical protein [Bacteroidota bacterium]